MTIIKILQYPDPRLRRVAIPVEDFGRSLQKTIDDMFETRYATLNCAALAATQLDMDPAWRITVIDLSREGNQPLCLVNPYILSREGEQIEEEGCMSVYPDLIHEKVKRAMHISVKAQDRDGKPLEFKAEGYLAKCIQHEVDHLDGKLYLHHLPPFKLDRIQRKVKRHFREQKRQA